MKNEDRNEIGVPLDEIMDIVRTHDRIFIYSTNPNLSDEEVRSLAEVKEGKFRIRRFTMLSTEDMILEKDRFMYIIEEVKN